MLGQLTVECVHPSLACWKQVKTAANAFGKADQSSNCYITPLRPFVTDSRSNLPGRQHNRVSRVPVAAGSPGDGERAIGVLNSGVPGDGGAESLALGGHWAQWAAPLRGGCGCCWFCLPLGLQQVNCYSLVLTPNVDGEELRAMLHPLVWSREGLG